MSVPLPDLVFASPRKLPRAGSLRGRVVVLDIAFAAEGLGKGFDKTTGKLIEGLGARLARWVDHHDHPLHARFAGDERFVLCTKAEHGACPEMIDPVLVADTGPIDTIVSHFDLDGLYAAAKWILGGHEPYPGADDDAWAVDTRLKEPSEQASQIDVALRAHWSDDTLKRRIVAYLVGGLKPGIECDTIAAAARDFERILAATNELARRYRVDRGIAYIEVPGDARVDKTELLLAGQRIAPVAVVADAGNVSIAAQFDSGLDFVQMLGIGGGMPTRVNIPLKHLPVAMNKIREELQRRRDRTT